jgi:hypothetical protein
MGQHLLREEVHALDDLLVGDVPDLEVNVQRARAGRRHDLMYLTHDGVRRSAQHGVAGHTILDRQLAMGGAAALAELARFVGGVVFRP